MSVNHTIFQPKPVRKNADQTNLGNQGQGGKAGEHGIVVSPVQVPANGDSRYHCNEFSRQTGNKSVAYPPDLYRAKIDG